MSLPYIQQQGVTLKFDAFGMSLARDMANGWNHSLMFRKCFCAGCAKYGRSRRDWTCCRVVFVRVCPSWSFLMLTAKATIKSESKNCMTTSMFTRSWMNEKEQLSDICFRFWDFRSKGWLQNKWLQEQTPCNYRLISVYRLMPFWAKVDQHFSWNCLPWPQTYIHHHKPYSGHI